MGIGCRLPRHDVTQKNDTDKSNYGCSMLGKSIAALKQTSAKFCALNICLPAMLLLCIEHSGVSPAVICYGDMLSCLHGEVHSDGTMQQAKPHLDANEPS